MRRVLPMVLLSALALPGAVAGADRSPFRPPAAIPLGPRRQPDALAAGDFNRDGKLDLVVASGGSNDLVVLLGDGHGGFRESSVAPAGENPTEICVADLDRDGNPDLAIANHATSHVTILLGNGRGGFRPAPGSPVTVHSKPHPHTIDACDVDGDGKLDLVIDSWRENRFTLLLGDGKGGFRGPGIPIEAGRKPYRNLRLRDLDGDGKCDLVAPNLAERGVTLLIGDGRGGFRGAAAPPVPAGPSPFEVQIGDVNRDGRPDLIVVNYSGHITDPSGDALTFLLGDGKGHFRLEPRIATGHAPFDAAVADINGDGFADVVVANGASRDLTVAFGGPDGLSPSRTATVPLGRRVVRVVLGDWNADGKADAATADSEDHGVSVLLAK